MIYVYISHPLSFSLSVSLPLSFSLPSYVCMYRSLGVVSDKIAQLSAPPVQTGNFQGVRGKR